MRNKIFALVLCMTLITLLFASCGKKKVKDREYNEAEVCAAAQVLIEKSKILNEIYYGAGIPYIEDESDEGVYRVADPEYMEQLYQNYGIKDVETLKEKTREVFSEAGSNSIISSKLTNTAGKNYARYYVVKKSGELMIHTEAQNYFENTAGVEYIYDGMYVSDVEGEYLTVALKVKTTGLDGSTNTKDFQVRLIEEASGYRLSGATYAAHP